MRRDEAKQLSACAHLIKAFADGETIQELIGCGSTMWIDVATPTFDRQPRYYRIKNSAVIKEIVRGLKISGMSYAAIGKRLGFSRQLAREYLAIGLPPVKGQKCEDCGRAENIQRHHKDYSTDEVQFLCVNCHSRKREKRHPWHMVDFGMSNAQIETQTGIPSRQVANFRCKHKIGSPKTFKEVV